MADTIFRFTNSSDTQSNVGTTEKIIFNTGTVPDASGKLVKTGFRMVTDLNPHPNPNRKLNKIQDSLLGIIEVTIAGYFKNHNTTLGPRNFYNWEIEDKKNSSFLNGRFGINIAAFNGILNVVPTIGRTTGIGYLLSEVDIQEVENPREKVPFIATFFRQGTPSVIPGKAVFTIPITVKGSYTIKAPILTVSDSPTGDDAKVLAILEGTEIVLIVVTKRGNGFITPPTISINNAGTGGSGLVVGTVVIQ